MLAEMNMSLLKKIEELTLYSIKQEKALDKQATVIERLEKENKSFKAFEERLVKLEKTSELK
jgi:hypothetical protein